MCMLLLGRGWNAKMEVFLWNNTIKYSFLKISVLEPHGMKKRRSGTFPLLMETGVPVITSKNAAQFNQLVTDLIENVVEK